VLGALGFGLLHQRTDPVDQLARLQRAADAVGDLFEPAHRYGAVSIGCRPAGFSRSSENCGADRRPAARWCWTYFGDMDVSELREKPAGRPADRNPHHIDEPASKRSPTASAARLQAGKLVYWICPLVESPKPRAPSTSPMRPSGLKKLRARFGDRVGLVNGQMKGTEKDRVMAANSLAHEIGLLVATTVVEVGVDVPAATIMVIENAERFGLAQLHQLRGRNRTRLGSLDLPAALPRAARRDVESTAQGDPGKPPTAFGSPRRI